MFLKSKRAFPSSGSGGEPETLERPAVNENGSNGRETSVDVPGSSKMEFKRNKVCTSPRSLDRASTPVDQDSSRPTARSSGADRDCGPQACAKALTGPIIVCLPSATDRVCAGR